MFCPNCGAEMPNGSKFCRKCGSSLEKKEEPGIQGDKGSQSNQQEPAELFRGSEASGAGETERHKASSSSKDTMNDTAPKRKRKLTPMIIGIIAAAVIIIAATVILIVVLSNGKITIDLDNYLTITIEGYDGFGTAKFAIDKAQLESDCAGKISLTSEGESSLYLQDNEDPVALVINGVDGSLSQSSGLSNGDEVTFTWVIDDTIEKFLNVKLNYSEITRTVSDLAPEEDLNDLEEEVNKATNETEEAEGADDTESSGMDSKTIQLMTNLDRDVTVYWIVSSGAEDRGVEALLNLYSAMNSHVHCEKKDPNTDSTFLENYGVENSPTDNSLLVVCGSRYRYIDYYEIYTVDEDSYYSYYYGYSESYDINFEGEQQLTSAIINVSADQLPILYTLADHGEVELSEDARSAVDLENYQIKEFSLDSAVSVPEDADVVLVYCPTSDLSPDETAALQDYLNQGGNLILITEPPNDVSMDNLYGLMKGYGITAEEGIVIEGNSSYYAGNYSPIYLLPKINSHTITDPLIDGGYNVLLPIAQGLTVSEDLPEDVSVTQILTTSDESFSKVAGYALDTYEKEAGDIDGPFAVGVAITETIDEDNESKLLWVSSPYLLDDAANSLVSGGNFDLFLNTLNWMAGDVW